VRAVKLSRLTLRREIIALVTIYGGSRWGKGKRRKDEKTECRKGRIQETGEV
jgi:hypothetical protein